MRIIRTIGNGSVAITDHAAFMIIDGHEETSWDALVTVASMHGYSVFSVEPDIQSSTVGIWILERSHTPSSGHRSEPAVRF